MFFRKWPGDCVYLSSVTQVNCESWWAIANKTANWNRLDCWQNNCRSFQRDCGNGNTLIDVRSMGVRRVWQWGGLKDGSPQRSRGRAPVGSGSWQHFLYIMHKYFIYWDFGQHMQHICSTKSTLQHFQWGNQVPPSHPMPMLRRTGNTRRLSGSGEEWTCLLYTSDAADE